jgi:hypothetical protein
MRRALRAARPSLHPNEKTRNRENAGDAPGQTRSAPSRARLLRSVMSSVHLSCPVTPDVFADLTQVVSPSDLNLTVRDTGMRQIPDFRRPFKTGMDYAIRLSTQTPGNEPDEAQPVTCI